MSEEALPLLAPREAIAALRAKGWQIAFSWLDVWQEEHARAFTVAKAMSRDLLEDIRGAVDQALAEGRTLQQFAKDLRPRLAARGWWGRKWMRDPQTGEEKVVQLGSPARLRTIYETNLRSSYMAGRWQRIERAKKLMPFIRYVSVMDGRERPQHHAWHGTVLPVDHEWWDTHFPPCGWGCRCDGQSLNQRMMDRKGWKVEEPRLFPVRDHVNKRTGEVTRLEQGIDPGWSYNVGKASLDALTPPPRTNQGEDGELQSTFSEGDYRRVRGFFAAFEMADRHAAMRGRIWHDASGWPMAISLGLFRGANGRMVKLPPRLAEQLPAAAQILLRPDRIGLVWVRGRDDRPMLIRRYQSAAGVVDIGRSFWRWRTGVADISPGHVIWAEDEGELAAYDPRQPRHPKGSRDGGRFRSTGRGDARASLLGDLGFFRTALIGSVSSDGAKTAAKAGVDIAGRGVKLEHSAARHIIKRHGPGRERQKGHRAITVDEVMNAHSFINSAHTIKAAKVTKRGLDRIVARSTAPDGARITIVADRSKRNLLLVTMHAKKKG